MTTPLPTPPSISRPTTFAAEAEAFANALVTYQQELDAYQATLSPLGKNLLLNAAFQSDQFSLGGATTSTDDAYQMDIWNILTENASVGVIQLVDPETGYTHGMRLTQSQVTPQRFGFSQPIEGKMCKHLRGNSGTLVPRVRISVSTPIRYAILGWTSTEDSLTSDPVLSWTNGTFTAGNFFLAANYSILGVGAVTPSANTWTSLTPLIASLGTAFNNIVIMVWTQNAQAQNVTLDCDYIQFEGGGAATAFERVPIAVTQNNIRRLFKSFGGSTNFEEINGGMVSTATTSSFVTFQHNPPMRIGPNLFFSAAGNWIITSNNSFTASAINIATNSPYASRVDFTHAALAANTGCSIESSNTTAARFGFDARL